jgi:hypothetical protein
MPTEPLKKILDRDLALVNVHEIARITSPLLRELVNNATNVFQRCNVAADGRGGVDEDIAPLCLYRIAAESTDSIDELIQRSCSLGALPLVRTAFEATLCLEYINTTDSARRGLCWLYVYVLNRSKSYRLLKSTTHSGQTFSTAWKKQFGKAFKEPDGIDKVMKNLESGMSKPHFRPITEEFDRMKSAKKKPEWYSLFGGPSNLRDMAISLNHEVDYDLLYRYWSSVAHANDASHFLTKRLDRGAAFWGMRHPTEIPQIALFAAQFLLKSTISMLARYRPSEDLKSWYLTDIKPRMDLLTNTRYDINSIEEE